MSSVPVFQSGPSVFKKLVRLAARAFYSGPCPPRQEGPGRRKWERVDTRGLAIVILDNLTQQEWVKEEHLAKELRVAPKLLLKALRYLEQERILRHESRKEGRRAKSKDIVVAATRKENSDAEEEEQDVPVKSLLQSYWAIDYPVFWNTLRLRIHLMRFKIKSEVEDSNSVMDYLCPQCQTRYTSLDFATLLNRETGQMICEDCGVEVLEQFGADNGGGKVEDKRKRREEMQAMLRKMDEELKIITDVMNQAKDVNPPDYGCLADWAYEENLKRKAKQHEIALGEQPLGLTEWDPSFDLDLNGHTSTSQKNIKEEKKIPEEKVLPPWMLKSTRQEVSAIPKPDLELGQKRKAELVAANTEVKKVENVIPIPKIEPPVASVVPQVAIPTPAVRLHNPQVHQAKKKIKIISTSPTFSSLTKMENEKKQEEEDDIEWEDAELLDGAMSEKNENEMDVDDTSFDKEAARLADLESDMKTESGWRTVQK